jgi:hypothetical protein
MNRRLACLLALTLGSLSLSLSANEPIDPKARYNAVFTMTRPDGMPDAAWEGVTAGLTMFKSGSLECRVDGNKVYEIRTNTLGDLIQKNIGRRIENPWRFELKWILTKCEKVPPTPEEIELEKIKKQQAEEDKTRQKLADENDPRRTVDAKGKPIYNAGSPEAEAQMRESAREQEKSAAKFKQYNKWGTNGPASPAEEPVRDTGAFDEDAAAERPAPAPANKFAKPQPQQGTKKADTLFKNQNQNSTGQFRAPDNFIAIWAHPQDRGIGNNPDRLVLVELTDSPKPVGMSLWQAKDRKYVPQDLNYTSLRVFPQ